MDGLPLLAGTHQQFRKLVASTSSKNLAAAHPERMLQAERRKLQKENGKSAEQVLGSPNLRAHPVEGVPDT